MIDFKKYGLLYRLHCLQGTPLAGGEEMSLLDAYGAEGLVAGSLTRTPAGTSTLELTPDGRLLVALMKRQLRAMVAGSLPGACGAAPQELPSFDLQAS